MPSHDERGDEAVECVVLRFQSGLLTKRAFNLTRSVYVRPPCELADPNSCLLRLLQDLYWLSDSGDYSHETLTRVLKVESGLQPSTGDPSLFYSTRKDVGLPLE